MGFEQVVDNLTVNHMDALRKQVLSLGDYVSTTVFGLCKVKEILRMIARIKLLSQTYLVWSDINERYDIG